MVTLTPTGVTQARFILFGGSFDPIHQAHLFIAESARQLLGAQRVLFLPTDRPHHRAALHASLADRLSMIRGAIAYNPAFALDTSDCDDSATGYTIDLVPRIRARFADAQLYFLTGEDSLMRSTWHRFDDVVSLLDAFAVARRFSTSADTTGFAELLEAQTPATREKIVRLDQPLFEISATQIRERVRRDETIRYLVPESVHRYIHEHRIYLETGATA